MIRKLIACLSLVSFLTAWACSPAKSQSFSSKSSAWTSYAPNVKLEHGSLSSKKTQSQYVQSSESANDKKKTIRAPKQRISQLAQVEAENEQEEKEQAHRTEPKALAQILTKNFLNQELAKERKINTNMRATSAPRGTPTKDLQSPSNRTISPLRTPSAVNYLEMLTIPSDISHDLDSDGQDKEESITIEDLSSDED